MTEDENYEHFPFLHRRYVQVKTENLEQYCDLLGELLFQSRLNFIKKHNFKATEVE